MTGLTIKTEKIFEAVSLLNCIKEYTLIGGTYFTNHLDKKNITIANALTMKTGIDFIDGDHTRPLYETDGSSIDYIL